MGKQIAFHSCAYLCTFMKNMRVSYSGLVVEILGMNFTPQNLFTPMCVIFLITTFTLSQVNYYLVIFLIAENVPLWHICQWQKYVNL